MATINNRYQDELIRHSVELERFKGGAADRAIAIMNETEEDLERLLRKRLDRLQPGLARFDRQAVRLERLLKAVRDQRAVMWAVFRKQVRGDMTGLAAEEVGFLQNAFVTAAQLQDIVLVAPFASAVRTAVLTRPFEGRPLRRWFSSLEAADQRNLEQAIRLGFIQGETTDQIVRRVRGTRANKFTDGVLQTSRRHADAIVRTGITHSATQAREALWNNNSDIIQAQKWTSTLDGRTTPICQARDGKVAPTQGGQVPPGSPILSPPDARPPAHVSCFVSETPVLPCGTVAAGTERGYEGEVVTVVTADGHEFTCTENHPILTDRGWVPAGLLDKGCRVVRYVGSENPFSSSEDEKENVHTSIEDLTTSFGPSVLESFGESNAADFHGDGVEGEVYIVRTYGLLDDGAQTPTDHHLMEEIFQPGIESASGLFRQGSLDPFGASGCSSTGGGMGGSEEGSPFLGAHPLPSVLRGSAHLLSILFPGPPEYTGILRRAKDSTFSEDAIYGLDRAPETPSNLADGLAGKVKLDDVVFSTRKPFCGHVYNLQTSTGVYFVSTGNIIAHNCRSTMIAIVNPDGVVGSRPFVVDTSTGRARTIRFRSLAQEKAGHRWKRMTAPQRRRATATARRTWAKDRVGTVPAETTYAQWLTRQPAGFQNEVLGGVTRGRLFRQGNLSLDKFIDRSGRRYNLKELRSREATAFRAANIELQAVQ